MLLKEFPDIRMVRQLKSDAARGTGNAWKNVVLNFKCRQASRLDLESPYSLFINKSGHSYCSVNDRSYKVETDTFLLAQPGDMYGLTVDNLSGTELCNVHINRFFFTQAAYSLTRSHEQLLSRPETDIEEMPPLFSQLYRKDEQLQRLTDRLTDSSLAEQEFEQALLDIISYLLQTNEALRRQINSLPFTRPAVREDIYKRLSIASDYMYSNYAAVPDLDAIAQETAMSKFHFLRVFKQFYGVTPYQFITRVRMQKAADMLRSSQASVAEISDTLGFEYPNSFIKAFQKSYKVSPLQFRKAK